MNSSEIFLLVEKERFITKSYVNIYIVDSLAAGTNKKLGSTLLDPLDYSCYGVALSYMQGVTNNVGSCCVSVSSGEQTDTTEAPNNVGT